ncbi:hypothetical protein CLV30_105213 [Haloactinopolyspora alba]|uniref:Hpr(Ser) kinase/phosphatase n=1 Tax=Haloactinopolyspora alba TaxID=648780 RepID=A0A2P8E5J7_9ACTN|nr:hypothetical protein [Haloactinopolyspora alba]PSL04746.1 hypothetical protein CLV30_105213 [Haloactinopolyspora alba]
MSGRLVVEVAGVSIEVVGADTTALRSVLGDVLTPDDAPAERVVDLGDAGPSGVETVLAAVARAAVEPARGLLLHAGAVVRDGRAVLFPGASGQGKSTLTAACLQQGFDYLSDELVAVDLDTGTVTGWPRPLMLTPWSAATLGLDGADGAEGVAAVGAGKTAVAAAALGAAPVRSSVEVAHVVLARRDGGAAPPVPVAAGDVLREVLAASFNHYVHGARAWQAAARLAGSAHGWLLGVGDVATAADAVAALLDGSGAAAWPEGSGAGGPPA